MTRRALAAIADTLAMTGPLVAFFTLAVGVGPLF